MRRGRPRKDSATADTATAGGGGAPTETAAAPPHPAGRVGGVSPTRGTIGQALAQLALESDPELCRVASSSSSISSASSPAAMIRSSFGCWRSTTCGRSTNACGGARAALLDRVRRGRWRLVSLPDNPARRAVEFQADQLGELTPDSFDIAASAVILGGRRWRVRLEEQDHPRRRPIFDLVMGRVEEALAEGRISWADFLAMSEEAMRARFHGESRTARNVVRAVRAALRRQTGLQ